MSIADSSEAARDFAERGLFIADVSARRKASVSMSDEERLLTLAEAQNFCLQKWGLTVSMTTLRRYVRKGALRVKRHGAGPKQRIRVRGSVLVSFFEKDIGQD